MAFLDKFNDWYVHLIPESQPGITWTEPAEGAKYRWKAHLSKTTLTALLMFPVVLAAIHTGKHQIPGPPWGQSCGIAVGLVALIFAFGWIGSYYTTCVFISSKIITIGSGRSQKRVPLDRIDAVILGEEPGYRYLSFRTGDKEIERLYLDPNKEDAVFDLLKQANKAVTT